MKVSVLVLLLQRVSPKSLFLLDRHGFSDKLVDTVDNSNPRFGLISEQRLNLDFNTISSMFIADLLCPRLGQIVHGFGSILLLLVPF